MGALDEECVDVGQAHLAPGFAGTGQVSEQLADVVELLADRDLWVATMLPKMSSVVAQNRQGRWRTAFDKLPWWDRLAHYRVNAAQRAHRRNRKTDMGGIDRA